MTKEQLEHIRDSLSFFTDLHYMKDYRAFHECCDGLVRDTNGEINLEGHKYDCHLLKSIKMVDIELAKLEL